MLYSFDHVRSIPHAATFYIGWIGNNNGMPNV